MGILTRTRQRLSGALLVIALALAATACSAAESLDGGIPISVTTHDEFEAALTAQVRLGTPFELADLTPWAWDEVSIIFEGSTRTSALKETGYLLDNGWAFSNYGTVLVFSQAGSVVEAIGLRHQPVTIAKGAGHTFPAPGVVTFPAVDGVGRLGAG